MQTAPDKHDTERPGQAAPTISLADYPQLGLLAWDRAGTNTISEQDAFALYEREWRHVDKTMLMEKECQLIERLTCQYGQGMMNV